MNWRKFIVSAVTGAVVWTVALTPYMVLVTNTTTEQYLSWVLMQFILVPLVAPLVFWITEKAVRRLAE